MHLQTSVADAYQISCGWTGWNFMFSAVEQKLEFHVNQAEKRGYKTKTLGNDSDFSGKS